MNETAARGRCVQARGRELWLSVPIDLAFAAFFVILAAGLELAGLLP